MTEVSFLLKLLLLAIWIPSGFCIAEDTRIDLTEPDTGRKICSAVLKEGGQVVLTWRNSLFGLRVTEMFEARSDSLFLTEVTYASPQGSTPPVVPPEDG